MLIATIFGFRIDLAAPMGVGGLYSRAENVRAAEGSLRRLGRETIDVLYQHRLNPEVPIEETVGAIAELAREGIVLTREEVDRLATLVPPPFGPRYDEAMMAAIDSRLLVKTSLWPTCCFCSGHLNCSAG